MAQPSFLATAKASYNPFAPVPLKQTAPAEKLAAQNKARLDRIVAAQEGDAESANEADARAFRKPGDPATLPELIKFLNDRSVAISARLKMKRHRSRSAASRT